MLRPSPLSFARKAEPRTRPTRPPTPAETDKGTGAGPSPRWGFGPTGRALSMDHPAQPMIDPSTLIHEESDPFSGRNHHLI